LLCVALPSLSVLLALDVFVVEPAAVFVIVLRLGLCKRAEVGVNITLLAITLAWAQKGI
jgi:hypothetical protein